MTVQLQIWRSGRFEVKGYLAKYYLLINEVTGFLLLLGSSLALSYQESKVLVKGLMR